MRHAQFVPGDANVRVDLERALEVTRRVGIERL
jgi:hypothetical protein